MAFVKLDKLIDKNVAKSDLGQKVQAVMTLERFLEIVKEVAGGQIAKKVKPMYIKDKTLHLACLSSVVAQELKFQEEKILGLLNKEYGDEKVSRIRYIV